MSRIVSVAVDGAARARTELEAAIAAGEVVLFPADGLYGLACDPLRAEAIARIHAIKGRDEGKPAAVLYLSPLAMRELVASLGAEDAQTQSVISDIVGLYVVWDKPDKAAEWEALILSDK